MSSLTKGLGKVQVKIQWDPSPAGMPVSDLDLIAATYRAEDPYGPPAYLVHFASRSPDGTITLNHDSRDGRGFGWDEIITLEFDRLSPAYTRVIVGVVIQQSGGRLVFGDIARPRVQVVEGYTVLADDDFSGVLPSTAATVAEFTRSASGAWQFRRAVRGFDADPDAFVEVMGARLS